MSYVSTKTPISSDDVLPAELVTKAQTVCNSVPAVAFAQHNKDAHYDSSGTHRAADLNLPVAAVMFKLPTVLHLMNPSPLETPFLHGVVTVDWAPEQFGSGLAIGWKYRAMIRITGDSIWTSGACNIGWNSSTNSLDAIAPFIYGYSLDPSTVFVDFGTDATVDKTGFGGYAMLILFGFRRG